MSALLLIILVLLVIAALGGGLFVGFLAEGSLTFAGSARS